MKLSQDQLTDIGQAFEALTQAFPNEQVDIWVRANANRDNGLLDLGEIAFTAVLRDDPFEALTKPSANEAVSSLMWAKGDTKARYALRRAKLRETISKAQAELEAMAGTVVKPNEHEGTDEYGQGAAKVPDLQSAFVQGKEEALKPA